jgi:hypothetical protein
MLTKHSELFTAARKVVENQQAQIAQLQNELHGPLRPELKSMIDGFIISIATLTSVIAKHPCIDTGLLLKDWENEIRKLQVQPPKFSPDAFVFAAQFEELIRLKLPPSKS